MTVLLVWLTATLDDVEREIRAERHDATPDHYGMARCDLAWLDGPAGDCTCGLDIRQPVALAAVQADRAILAEHPAHGPSSERHSWSRTEPWCPRCSDADDGPTPYPCRTVLLVASRYAHRPGYLDATGGAAGA